MTTLARAAFEQGLTALAQGLLLDAETHLRTALAHAPGRPSVLSALGVTLLRQDRAVDALKLFDEALAAEPARAETWGHRGNALLALARPADALASFESAMQHGAPQASVDAHRAQALNALRRHAEALQCVEAVLREHPDDGALWLERGVTLRCLERHADALPALQRAVELAPTLGAAWSQLGQLLKDSADAATRAEAATAFEHAIALGEDPALHQWFIAALRGPGAGTVPAHAPTAFVQPLFDGYAGEFDRHLEALEYHAPTRLASLIATVRSAPVEAALDLGCGTGQCAAPLAALVRAIDGVDVSAAMLDVARATGRYRALHHAELTAWLADTHTDSPTDRDTDRDRRYGLVVAADVFIYVGALEAVFAGVQRVLVRGGLFALTAEIASTADANFELLPTLRYAHDPAYLRALAQAHGFSVALTHHAPLRLEQGRPLPGLYLVLQAA